MTWKSLIVALAVIAGSTPAGASQSEALPGANAPEAPPNALYCLRTEPVTGTRIGRVACLTREAWAEGDVDVDQAWAEDGVRVVT